MKHIKPTYVPCLLALISSPSFGADTPESDEEVSTNFSSLYKTYSKEDSEVDDDAKAKGVFGIEAGAAVDGDATSGAVFWYIQRQNSYGLKIGFNISNTAEVSSDLSNLGDIIRNADEFGQFTMTGVRIFRPFGYQVGLLGGLSYTELEYDNAIEMSPDNGGVVAVRLGVLATSSPFDFGNSIKGTVGLSLAYEDRRIVGDLSNNSEQIDTLFKGNGKNFSGLSGQIDINLSTNQRYFVKLTRFSDADGLNGFDGTQITVGIKIDGILVD
jgi:hypothetical protein